MFESKEMERIVSLQQKSYCLLQWVGRALRNGTLNVGTVHASMGISEAAREWIGRNLESFPPETRPDRGDLDAFAHLFASYLSTSFDLVEHPGQLRVSSTGCYCSFCSYLVSASYLKVKKPGRKAQQKARQMKEMYLAALGEEAGVPVSYTMEVSLLSDPALAEDFAYAAYGRELLRRSEFASQGEGVLVLWREIAWDRTGKIKKGFTLSAERILKAEAAIRDRLTSSAP